MFKKLRQRFCIHDWEPVELVKFYCNKKSGISYAMCKSICKKCGKKKDDVSYMLRGEFQKWFTNKIRRKYGEH